ncbi:MAG: TFIIB-type zinc ribbon-containing protein [Chloroflexi bacterium]|nr:TFIIB-type zinc ribbon-containing protein [Chloroflexota bacterium]
MSEQPAASYRAETFKCPQCGAPRLEYDPAGGGLKCPQCGYTRAIAAEQKAVNERDLTAVLSDAGKARGYGRETKSVNCKNCGATTQMDPSVVSTQCPFCGSTQVLEQKPDPNIVQPESLIPFQLTSDRAYDNYRKWLGKGFFRPRGVLKQSGSTQIQGVYLPFWTFDAHAESRWTAESGDYYYETEEYTTVEDGKTVRKTRQVQKVRWYPTSGHHSDDYDDVLVSGTTSGDQKMLQKIYPFDTSKLVPYQPQYLSGWAAEAYRIPLGDAWQQGQGIIGDDERGKCDRQVPGDTHRSLDVRTQLSDTTFKHVLLPVFLANYRYNSKPYQFMVNGQTGEVQGQAPVDWVKVAIVVVIALAILLAVAYFVLSHPSSGGSGQGLLPAIRFSWATLSAHVGLASTPPLLL